MEAAGHAITDTVLRHIERCEKAKGVSLDDAFALIEALDAVPLYMFTPPNDKFIRLSKSVATDGEGMLGWFVSGLPDRIEPERRQPPPAEITGAVEREQQFARMARLAHALVDADREEDGVRDERMQRAWNALMREARHQEPTSRKRRRGLGPPPSRLSQIGADDAARLLVSSGTRSYPVD